MSLTPDHFNALITALRSDKYLQAESQLRGVPRNTEPGDVDDSHYDWGYCCLGVYCVERGVDLDEYHYNTEHDSPDPLGEFGGVTQAQIEWTPLENVLGDFTEEQRTELARMNDAGRTFIEIADYLEQHRSEFVGA